MFKYINFNSCKELKCIAGSLGQLIPCLPSIEKARSLILSTIYTGHGCSQL